MDSQGTATKPEPLRIFTSIIRKWQTITGHAPDGSLVPPAEFQALCLIAAAGEQGILQTDLTKLSGQDKRSLPKRTDRLARNGYIKKRPCMNTSHLLHRKFWRSVEDGSRNLPATQDIFKPDGFELGLFMTFIAKFLESEGAVTLMSLHAGLGLEGATTKQFRRVRKGLEKLEATGVISRFRARRQERTNGSQTEYIRCIKLNRMPTDEDREKAHGMTTAQLEEFRARLERESNQEMNDNGHHDPHLDSTTAQQDVGDDHRAEALEQTSLPRHPSFLDPDEPFPNFLFRAVQSYGARGVSTTVS
jgi:DNA-binding Lrp family transcriptional regulator